MEQFRIVEKLSVGIFFNVEILSVLSRSMLGTPGRQGMAEVTLVI